MLELKKQGKIRGVIVSGCLAERQKEQLLEQRPAIDALVGVFARDAITQVADRLLTRLLYPGHPYGHLPLGLVSTLRTVTPEDVRAFHAAATQLLQEARKVIERIAPLNEIGMRLARIEGAINGRVER